MLDALLTAQSLTVSEPLVETAPTVMGTLRLVAEYSHLTRGDPVVGLAKRPQSTASCSGEERLPARKGFRIREYSD